MGVWSRVPFSGLTNDLRIDPEHYRPEYLRQATLIMNIPHKPLSPDVAHVSDGNHLAVSERFSLEGVRYLRGQDLTEFFVSDSDPVFIPDAEYGKLARSHMHPGDVLLGIVGTIGSVGLVTERFGKLTGNCKLAIIRSMELEPEYLAAFFASKVGQNEIARRIRGTVQMGLILPDLRQIPIPLLGRPTRQGITDLVKQSYERWLESRRQYDEAGRLLLSELGIGSLNAPPPLSYERFHSDTKNARRMDAEFYQPNYYRLLQTLRQASRNKKALPISSLSARLRYGTSDKLMYVESGVPFLRLTDLERQRFDPTRVLRISEKEASEQRAAQVRAGDVLISRSGTLGVAVAVPSELDGAIFGSYFIRVRPDQAQIHPEYLALYINSPCGSAQVQRLNTGAVQTNLTIPAIESIYVVFGDLAWQGRLVGKIRDSMGALNESKRLLERAKREVEEAVESGGS
jgi:hypothetical protein